MSPTRPRGPFQRIATALLFVAFAAPSASALVDGTRASRVNTHTVLGGSAIIGNTVLASTNGGVVNDTQLTPGQTIASLSAAPADAQLVAA